jgi:hypothetical protein
MTTDILVGLLVLIILFLGFVIEKQREYIDTIEEISNGKSKQIEHQHKIIQQIFDEP